MLRARVDALQLTPEPLARLSSDPMPRVWPLLSLLALIACVATVRPQPIRAALASPSAETFEQLTAVLRATQEHGVAWLAWGRPARAPVVVLSSYLNDIRTDTTWAVPAPWAETWIAAGLITRLRPAGAPLVARSTDTLLVTLSLPRYHADTFDSQAGADRLRDSVLVGVVHVDRTVPHGHLDCGTELWLRLRPTAATGWSADSVLVRGMC